MIPAFLGELAFGLGLLTMAVLGGIWLKGLYRRQPKSILVNEGVIADMVCVGEIALLVSGAILLIRGFMGVV